jgi:hypothetical protein
MLRADSELPAAAAQSPQVARLDIPVALAANFHRQTDPQPLDGRLPIQVLAAAFAGLAGDAARPVGDDDGGLDFVAVLPARTAAARAADVARGEKVGQW